jgi:hypothetical protein
MKSADFRSIVKLTDTRFQNSDVRIYIGKIGAGLWQCVVEQDGNMAQTGEQSKTKMEAFSILPQVAKSWGFEV